MFVSDAIFKVVLESTPLVSIDLLVVNNQQQVLLGRRNNRPAENYWFVPGGRIQKNESLAAAFSRLTKEELGQQLSIECATLQGAYDHFYADCVYGEDISTHYVALAYILPLSINDGLPTVQHSEYKWFPLAELKTDPEVHGHTKAYFLTKDLI